MEKGFMGNYRSVALLFVVLQCFERLVCQQIKTSLPPTLDPFQFTYQFNYRTNQSTKDTINVALHTALSHLTMLRLQLAFNHIILKILD